MHKPRSSASNAVTISKSVFPVIFTLATGTSRPLSFLWHTISCTKRYFSILSFNGISNSTVLFMVLCLQFFQGLTCWSLRMRTSYPRKRAVSLLCVIRVFSWLSSIFSPLWINSVSFPHSQSALLPFTAIKKSSAYRTYFSFLSLQSFAGVLRISFPNSLY